MTPAVTEPSNAEKRRQQLLDRRKQNAIEVLAGKPTAVGRPAMSFLAEVQNRAIPRTLLERGLITFDPTGQPRVASYDPSLLAPNPQRGRLVDRGLDELAKSLNAHGQQEPIIARLITETDRKRWPGAFDEKQILLILKGHRIYNAQPNTRLQTLRVELMLPLEGEDDVEYGRRALRRASIKVMHSQSYDIFDKVHQFGAWCQEFSLDKPKDAEVAEYFEVSRTEAQRLRIVAQLDEKVAQDILNADRKPADEVIFHIANRPVHEHRDAFERFGQLTVAAVRKIQQADTDSPSEGQVTISGAGRPKNFVLAIRDEGTDITYISTALTAKQWKRRGGAKAFWKTVRELASNKDVLERLEEELG